MYYLDEYVKINGVMVDDANYFQKLAASARGRERAFVAAGAAEETAGSTQQNRVVYSIPDRRRTVVSRETLETQHAAVVAQEERPDLELYGTEADPRHPTEMSPDERRHVDALYGVELPISDEEDRSTGFTTEIRRSKPK